MTASSTSPLTDLMVILIFLPVSWPVASLGHSQSPGVSLLMMVQGIMEIYLRKNGQNITESRHFSYYSGSSGEVDDQGKTNTQYYNNTYYIIYYRRPYHHTPPWQRRHPGPVLWGLLCCYLPHHLLCVSLHFWYWVRGYFGDGYDGYWPDMEL